MNKKQPEFSQDDYQIFQQFLEFKKNQNTKTKPRVIKQKQEFEEYYEQEGSFLVAIGILAWMVTGIYTFLIETDIKNVAIGVYCLLTMFFIFGYSVNKNTMELITKFYAIYSVGWAIWKMGVFA